MNRSWTLLASAALAIATASRAAELPTIPLMQTPPPAKAATRGPNQKLTPDAQLLTPEDLAARRKLSAFVTCLNGVTAILPNLSRPYRDAFRAVSRNLTNGIDSTSYTWMYQSNYLLHGPQTMGHPPLQECADRLAAAVAKPPADEPLDTLGTAYAADLLKLDVLAPKVEAYYNGKDFRDDKMARGRTLNAEYEPLLQRLLDGGRTMFVLARAREDVLQQRRLDSIERMDGKQLRWQANAFLMQSRSALDGLKALIAEKKVTKAAVLALVTPLETRFAEASNYAVAHPDENNEEMTLWAAIAGHSYAADFLTAAKQARRDADDPGTIAKVPNDAERMSYNFNNMLDYTNSSKR